MIYTRFAYGTWITRFDRIVIMRKFRSGLKIEHYPKCIAVLPRLSGARRVALKFILRKHTSAFLGTRILFLTRGIFVRTVVFSENSIKTKRD